jgi:hypothetical protein
VRGHGVVRDRAACALGVDVAHQFPSEQSGQTPQ